MLPYYLNLNKRLISDELSLILLEIAKIVRSNWPKNKILGARVTGSDWLESGITIDDTLYLTKKLKDIGLDYVCVSSGGIIAKTNIKFKKGYQVHLAEIIKKKLI